MALRPHTSGPTSGPLFSLLLSEALGGRPAPVLSRPDLGYISDTEYTRYEPGDCSTLGEE